MFPIRDHNPSGRTPFVTYALIAINVGVFMLYYPVLAEPQLSYFFFDWGFVPRLLSDGHGFAGLITHMFLHGGWLHLAGNMLFLFIFGDNVEGEMGHGRFAVFYLLSGLAAAGLQYVADPMSTAPMVGASGAIAGVMGAYLLLFPKAKVDVLFIFVIFFRIFPIPAWIVLGLWFGLQLFNGATVPSADGGVAYLAHVGGFLAGLVLAWGTWSRLGGTAFWSRTEGHPPHPAAEYALTKTSIPRIPRR